VKKKVKPITQRTMLCIAPMHNTKGRKDATGAFIPEAKRFLEFHKQDSSMLHLIDNHLTKKEMMSQVLSLLSDFGGIWPNGRPLEGIFFFCHGYRKGIQFGFTTKSVDPLAEAIHAACGERPIVTFYSCDVARDPDRSRFDDLEGLGGDGGFADEMRDALCRVDSNFCIVDGHTTVGHTTKNPHVRRFNGDGSFKGGIGGYYIVPRQKKNLFKKWRKALRGDLRFEYPFMSADHIVSSLSGT
jgi:hypothetical protein